MQTLYEIKNEYLEALDAIEYNEDGEVIGYEKLKELEGLFDEKAESVACYIKSIEAEAKAIKDEIERLKERLDAKESKAETLKDYLTEMMEAADKSKLETSKVKISFRTSKSANIIDEAKIPEWFFEEVKTKKLLKKDVLDALKSGSTVEGAELLVKKNIQLK